MSSSQWIEIVSADDDVASGELLDWSGLSDVWDKHDLSEQYDFVRDVAEYCDHIDIELEHWDANMPGRSGVWHRISTDDEKALKRELALRLHELIE
jgi:hypothetical protein